MAFVNGGAELGQAIGDRRQLQVGAGNGVTQVEQHFGDAAHPDSSDPREVQVAGLQKNIS